jgi:4a-hydroxytetrahydrobiopterin dehydratase
MRLSADQVQQKMSERTSWVQDGDAIRREFVLDDFSSAVAFIVRIGFAAEAADHHPDISLNRYKRVTLSYTTHSAGGLTEKDFAGAAAADAVYASWTGGR